MGFSSMIRWLVRVAAFTAIACLSVQAACSIGVPQLTSAQNDTRGDSGCHESAPPTPNGPVSSHICCSGDHSPDALLSAIVTPVPLVSGPGVLDLTLALRFFAPSSADLLASFSPPRQGLPLRI